MPMKTAVVGPALLTGVVGASTAALLRQMENEYAQRDTLSRGTAAAMYATYGAYAAALAWGCRRRTWPISLPSGPARLAGTAAALLGAGVALAGARPFGAGKQLSGIEPGSLHSSGIYRYSRNPQYLGLGLVATGLAASGRSAFAGMIAAGVWASYRRWIPSEERHLTRVFGEEYLDYTTEVRRWIGSRSKARRKQTRRPHLSH
ncbi:isoprenylcysteine carboxylmethyltransferase family protein [Pseudonocardia sp. DSM 110487]|uniref:methyltransferase family protein n=1 Tax=Pseudonocardia sp. DSM 110487 TaxID=2865833 RepID=UPI001C69A47F|nr:isoprenylcysteine carboxylmethyltransferase family protein [Pseudonocardia sp. DSM 110487]QYN33663.1 isoprenylcysteine carboxylmethyltransferase family protein [Pseudonocardia sp. DSM 110487]